MSKEISVQDLELRLESANPPVLLEALPAKYYEDWHLPGARNLPHDEVRRRAETLVPDKAASIVVYCASASCRNSHIAASQLVSLGYTDVAVFTGGKEAWSEAGLRVDRGVARAA
jgi:rhodanese-related sulfurtransferase